MENHAFQDENPVEDKQEEVFESFVCCVCLDLLYKPIVLSCGHISCFWCVHKSMNGYRESHCPICRHPYYHFPTICQMLHFLLLKIYPVAYKRRETQMLEEEKKMGFFSPQFDAATCGSQAKFDDPSDPSSCSVVNVVPNFKSFECMEPSESAALKGDEGNIYSGHTSNGAPEVIGIGFSSIEGKILPQNEHHQQQTISLADVMCIVCKKLLFHPVVLNCGHVYCEDCIINLADEMLRCQVCQSPHPRGFPKVCLALDHFLEEQFSEEYTQRRDSLQLSQIKVKPETPSCSLDNGNGGEKIAWWSNPGSKVHCGVGCDFCGMYPIIGDRYKCIDCKEIVGFDLCGDCYKAHSKLPGRFNQHHTSEHKFQLVKANGTFRGQFYGQESLENLALISEDSALFGVGEHHQDD